MRMGVCLVIIVDKSECGGEVDSEGQLLWRGV